MVVDLQVQLGRLRLPNPVLVASGTFGYAREMAHLVQLDRLGGILPKTITAEPRAGNRPWRTVETSAGLLNSIGLDNDGVEAFIEHHLPYLAVCGAPIIVSVAGRTEQEFVSLAQRIGDTGRAAAIELNISCPNVSGGVDFGTDPGACHRLVAATVARCPIPVLAKLTPNVTRIVEIAKAASEAGADAVSLINTVTGMAIDWRRQRPLLGNVIGGLSGPAIKPIALRCVHQVFQALKIPIIGIGGIQSLDDAMEFIVAGAAAFQIGTANYYDPQLSMRLLDQLPVALADLGVVRLTEAIGTLQLPSPTPSATGTVGAGQLH
jgi:dihydroorotate dehydrogenase (NAD+) catalytic subunit